MSFESAAVARQKVADQTGWAVGDPRLALPEGELRARWPAAFPDQAPRRKLSIDLEGHDFGWNAPGLNVDPKTMAHRQPTSDEVAAQLKQPPLRVGWFVDRNGGLWSTATGGPMMDLRKGTADEGKPGDPVPEWFRQQHPELAPAAVPEAVEAPEPLWALGDAAAD